MTRIRRYVSLILLSLLWLAGCGAAVQPSAPPAAPTLPPASVTIIPDAPTAQPGLSGLETPAAATPINLPTIASLSKAQIQAKTAQLIEAAEAGDTPAVLSLLAQGAEIDGRDAQGRTALIAAAYRNDLAMADLLIQAGADVNAQDKTKQSAYLIATSEGYLELLKRTLQAGADVYSLDSFNGTGLIRAAERGHVEIIQELLKTDIRIDHVNNLGWTALLEAIILGTGGTRHTEVVRLLVEAGADVNLADSFGVTPLSHARQLGYEEMIEILQDAGAH